jgi:hypothetical protein
MQSVTKLSEDNLRNYNMRLAFRRNRDTITADITSRGYHLVIKGETLSRANRIYEQAVRSFGLTEMLPMFVFNYSRHYAGLDTIHYFLIAAKTVNKLTDLQLFLVFRHELGHAFATLSTVKDPHKEEYNADKLACRDANDVDEFLLVLRILGYQKRDNETHPSFQKRALSLRKEYYK